MPSQLIQQVTAACDDVVARCDDPEVRAAVTTVRASLQEPLRLAVVGRVSSGKSTLVNALLGRRVAPTDVGECTRLVTRFRFGYPERVEVVGVDGTKRVTGLSADGTIPNLPSAGLAYLDVYLSETVLETVTLVDTPGLASASERPSAPADLCAIDDRSRAALRHADAMLFMLAPPTRQEDVAVLSAFRDLFAGIRASAVNAVGVLSKIDKLGDDATDPWPEARSVAGRQAELLSPIVSRIVPVMGLIAETSSSREFTEDDARALRELADLGVETRERLLLSVDRFRNSDVPILPGSRARLLGLLDLHGIRLAIEAIGQGKTEASDLLRELHASSGIEALQELVRTTFRRQGEAIKADWAIAALNRACSAGDGHGPQLLRSRLEDLRLSPEFHRVEEMATLHDLAAGSTNIPDSLRADLERLATGISLPERLGVPQLASADDLRSAALEAATRWRAFLNDPRASRSQARVAATVCRSFELMIASL
ncbi:MAG: dynamin family protein [Actinomycetota bacterium]|nr:dynamin family protein [Actinomycetota bacterium]